ncbi:MAG: SphA family protein, partial [bacterium]
MLRMSIERPRTIAIRLIGITALSAVGSAGALAQANVPQFRGDVGLLAGTQAPRGSYIGVFHNADNANHVIDGSGMSRAVAINSHALALLLEYSSNYQIFGGRWAAIAAPAWVSAEFALPNIATSPMWGFSDLYVVPLQLGWSSKKADLVFGQGFFAPTGRFEQGNPHNTGRGMWSYESTLGGTLYAGSKRLTSFSTLASYQVNSHVKDSDKRPGQTLVLEGGVGQEIPAVKGRAGVVYYARWKLTDDQGFPILERFLTRDRYYG